MSAHIKASRAGFTLIELLVVIGILAVLLAIVLIAINPARQFAQANNTQRSSNVNSILNAIDQYAADNHGTLPTGINNSSTEISKVGVDICSQLVTRYLASLPVDPKTGSNGLATGQPVSDCTQTYSTRYFVVSSSSDNRVTVNSPDAELNATISVTR